MQDLWKSQLSADPTGWLLEPDNPGVRFLTLTEILDRPLDDPQVIAAQSDIWMIGPVPKFLERQNPSGYWGKAQDFYIRSKYRGTVWSLIALAELGAYGHDPRLARACDFILAHSQEPVSGAFSYKSDDNGAGFQKRVLPCLSGNMIWCLIRFGYLQDSRVQQGIHWLVSSQRLDDGDQPPPDVWPYQGYEDCWGRHTCMMGIVKPLKALAEIPADQRSAEVQIAIQSAVEFLGRHHIYKSSRHPEQVANPDWLSFGFPLMWNTDALEMAWILSRLGCRQSWMEDAVSLILSKQGRDGRWLLESTYNGRFQVMIEKRNKPSKWVTLHALQVIKHYYSDTTV
ncbi:MAG: hypothetical protein P4L50_11375 [Anaerolineaceae bacterium]|nr:hypothetical protein [Anaerolineaceae bacterium]